MAREQGPMENMDLRDTFAGKKVCVTGHTGFKGSWLCEWLLLLGADVTGLSLEPPTQPALFEQLGLKKRLTHQHGDINDAACVRRVIHEARPDFIFHLAAQPIVRASYRQPVETFATNVMGTVHVLDALRDLGRPCTAVLITTDKCYENRDWLHGYREEDSLGGHDPYSASKAAAEIVIASYRRSFFSGIGGCVRVASARAGNVIGGGDWAEDRIVPDAIRHLSKGEPIPVRNPASTRPWQHVLEPLNGYLRLAAALSSTKNYLDLASAFNFGPAIESNRSVKTLIEQILTQWPGTWKHVPVDVPLHEARLLHLSHDKAYHLLGWKPQWNFETTIANTIGWYRQVLQGANAAELSRQQIETFMGSPQ